MGGSSPAFVVARAGGEYGFVTAFVRQQQPEGRASGGRFSGKGLSI